jgi:hypothetical protein
MQPSKSRGAPIRNVNAFKHGFTSKVFRESPFLLLHHELLKELTGAGRRDKEQASKALLESLDYLRRVAAAKVSLINAEIDQSPSSDKGSGPGLAPDAGVVACVYAKLIPALERLHRYEREAARRFESAYRAYIIAHEKDLITRRG